MTMTAKEIIRAHSNLATRPECYSGRGNTTSDLDSSLLERIYGGVQTEIGDDAAKAFVNMVNKMTINNDASASTFLLSFYQLERHGWSDVTPVNGIAESFGEMAANALKSEDAFSLAGLMQGTRMLMAGHDNETPAGWITGMFLMKHMKDIEGDEAPRTPYIIYHSDIKPK